MTSTGRPIGRTAARLITALIDFLDADAADAPTRERLEGDARSIVDDQAVAAGRRRDQPDRRGLALRRRARQPFLAELSGLGRRRSLDPTRLAELYGDASAILDRLLLRFIATHQSPAAATWRPRTRADRHGHPGPPPGHHLDPRAGVQPCAVRPVARAPGRLPAHLGLRHAVLRHRGGRRGAGRGRRLERDPVSHAGTSPARSGRRAGWASGRRSCLVARGSATASRCACSWPALFTLLTQHRPDYPGAGTAPLLYFIAAVSSPWPWRSRRTSRTSAGRSWRRRPWSGRRSSRVVLMLTVTLPPPGYALDPATGMPVGTLFPRTLRLLTPFLNVTGCVRADPRRDLHDVCLHAEAARPGLLARSEPTGRRVPVQSADRAGRHRGQSVASLPGAVRALLTGRIHSRVPATILIAIGGLHPDDHRFAQPVRCHRALPAREVPGRPVPVRWLPRLDRGVPGGPGAVHEHHPQHPAPRTARTARRGVGQCGDGGGGRPGRRPRRSRRAGPHPLTGLGPAADGHSALP